MPQRSRSHFYSYVEIATLLDKSNENHDQARCDGVYISQLGITVVVTELRNNHTTCRFYAVKYDLRHAKFKFVFSNVLSKIIPANVTFHCKNLLQTHMLGILKYMIDLYSHDYA